MCLCARRSSEPSVKPHYFVSGLLQTLPALNPEPISHNIRTTHVGLSRCSGWLGKKKKKKKLLVVKFVLITAVVYCMDVFVGCLTTNCIQDTVCYYKVEGKRQHGDEGRWGYTLIPLKGPVCKILACFLVVRKHISITRKILIAFSENVERKHCSDEHQSFYFCHSSLTASLAS